MPGGTVEKVRVGDVLRKAREAKGVSARALSIAAGLSPSYVGKVESGEMDGMRLRCFGLIAKELDLTDREIALLVKLEADR